MALQIANDSNKTKKEAPIQLKLNKDSTNCHEVKQKKKCVELRMHELHMLLAILIQYYRALIKLHHRRFIYIGTENK